MNLDFGGRSVVITGGGGALGGAVVDAFLAAGASCHLPVRKRGADVRDDARLRVTEGVDLADEAAVSAYYASCPPLWASIHLAGGFAAAPVLETTLRDLREAFEMNLVTAFLCCREAVRNIRAKAQAGGGRIVNVGSRAALVAESGKVAYTISKGGVGALTQALAKELEGDRILVNAVVPSTIDTAANRTAMPNAAHDRWPKPAEIAATIAWLASPACSVTSGVLLPVYGRA